MGIPTGGLNRRPPEVIIYERSFTAVLVTVLICLLTGPDLMRQLPMCLHLIQALDDMYLCMVHIIISLQRFGEGRFQVGKKASANKMKMLIFFYLKWPLYLLLRMTGLSFLDNFHLRCLGGDRPKKKIRP